jgi:hypothetical protein
MRKGVAKDFFTLQSLNKDGHRTRSLFMKLAILLIALFFYGCGGDSSSTSTTQTRTFTGQTVATSPTTCEGDSHDFVADDGTITATLTSSTGNTSLVLQICAGGIDNNNCTVNQTAIAVGQSISGTRKGAASQNLKLLPLNCGGGGPAPTTPIQYTVTVTFPG